MKSPVFQKRDFSQVNLKEAFERLQLTRLIPWKIDCSAITPTDFFWQYLDRLQCFSLHEGREAKQPFIDAICQEALSGFTSLKCWKGAVLKSNDLRCKLQYLFTSKKSGLEPPFLLSIAEAYQDDFEQGLARCLVEMQVCQWQNRQANHEIDVFGIVTNGEGWRFYRLTITGEVYETPVYSVGDMDLLLGRLRHIFERCEQNLLQDITP
ncbi:hypothetical protein [Thermocoleostomius sinensis]|uniref:Uncharacterized protein n=1 Tax=Thermocoleostomius sinensis A174 TaxID=2016057 RepID=A0A9E8ZHC4_9CYAN|nr:hypothetical protein [Thermocoleostomius sinensis]WAL61215.1 hypothetical protein OXH18_04230 [Thermocoleostomius sinensis A174]